METVKLIFLVTAYSLGVATFIIQIVCYLKNIEYKETILLILAFLLVIISYTIHFFYRGISETEHRSCRWYQTFQWYCLLLLYR